jgi:hypothetical protein
MAIEVLTGEETLFTESSNRVDELEEHEAAEIVSMVCSDWRESTNAFQALFDASLEGWDYLLCNRPRAEAVHGSTRKADIYSSATRARQGFRLGKIPKAIDSSLAYQHNSTFPGDERFFRATPRNELSIQHQEFIERYMAEAYGQANIPQKFRGARLATMVDGSVCIFAPFKQKINKNKMVWAPKTISTTIPLIGKVEIPIPGTLKKTHKDVVEWQGTDVEVLELTDWRIDPHAKCADDTWFMRRWYEPVHRVKEKYSWLEDVVPYAKTHADTTDSNDAEKADLMEVNRSIPHGTEEEGDENALLMIRYDDFVIDGEVYENHVAVVVNDSELVWFGKNEYNHGKKPYIIVPYFEVPNFIHGMSMIKHAIPSAEVIDKATNSAANNLHWSSGPVWLKNMTDKAVQKYGDMEVKPNMTIPVSKPGAFQQLQVDLGNIGFSQQLILENEKNIQEVTGATDMLSGDSPQRSEVTAFEVDMRTQGTGGRHQMVMDTFNNKGLECFLQMDFENLKQFSDEDLVLGDEVLPIDALKQLDYKFIITSTQATLSRNRELANMKMILMEVLPAMREGGLVKFRDEIMEVDHNSLFMDFMTKGGIRQADKHFKRVPVPSVDQAAPIEANELNGGIASGLPSVPPTPNESASSGGV